MSAGVDRASLEALVERLRSRIGMTTTPVTRQVEAGALIKFARATGQTDPLYLSRDAAAEGPFGAVVAAPTYISTFVAEAMGGTLIDLDLPLSMFLHTDDAVELGAPILAGDDIAAVARYADAYLRDGRDGPLLFQIAEIEMTNQHGQQVAQLRVGAVSFNSPVAR